jgi:hypothetical protein
MSGYEQAPSRRIVHRRQTRPEAMVGLFGEILRGWQIRQLLPIQISREEDGSFIVSDDIFFVYGEGSSQEDALHDYVASLTEYYEIVAEGARSEPFDQSQFKHLQLYIRRR